MKAINLTCYILTMALCQTVKEFLLLLRLLQAPATTALEMTWPRGGEEQKTILGVCLNIFLIMTGMSVERSM